MTTPTPEQIHRPFPVVAILPSPPPTSGLSGTMTFSVHDLINMGKDASPVSKRLIESLTKKWKMWFRLVIDKYKTTREFVAPFSNLPFKNRYGVKWQPPQISVDNLHKTFRISARPTSRQDQLCFDPVYDPGFHISLTGTKLKFLIAQFFETINQARWCTNCGEFSWSYAYNSDLEICDHCLIEEICASSNAETFHCSICLEEGKRMYKTRCGHRFHRSCLSKVESVDFGPKCPLCRVYLDPHDEHMSNTAQHSYMGEDENEAETEIEAELGITPAEPEPTMNIETIETSDF